MVLFRKLCDDIISNYPIEMLYSTNVEKKTKHIQIFKQLFLEKFKN